MDKIKRHSGVCHFFTALIACFLMMSLVLSGCEPLRKKFIRKKKKEREETTESIPILEPMEYPAKVDTPQDMYKYHYSLWQVWHKELINDILDNASQKHALFSLSQVILHLEEIKKLLSEEKQDVLSKDIKSLEIMQDDFRSSLSNRDETTLKLKLESMEKRIRKAYAFKNIQESIKK